MGRTSSEEGDTHPSGLDDSARAADRPAPKRSGDGRASIDPAEDGDTRIEVAEAVRSARAAAADAARREAMAGERGGAAATDRKLRQGEKPRPTKELHCSRGRRRGSPPARGQVVAPTESAEHGDEGAGASQWRGCWEG